SRLVYFFFSSRRRHTRFSRDWSSDVCSSDLFDLIPRIKKARPELPIIVMSAQNTLMTALAAAEKGAFEYLPKPFDLNELVSVVGRALAEPSRKAIRSVADSESDELPLIGRSPAMQEIYRIIARLTQTDLTVMITGDAG